MRFTGTGCMCLKRTAPRSSVSTSHLIRTGTSRGCLPYRLTPRRPADMPSPAPHKLQRYSLHNRAPCGNGCPRIACLYPPAGECYRNPDRKTVVLPPETTDRSLAAVLAGFPQTKNICDQTGPDDPPTGWAFPAGSGDGIPMTLRYGHSLHHVSMR